MKKKIIGWEIIGEIFNNLSKKSTRETLKVNKKKIGNHGLKLKSAPFWGQLMQKVTVDDWVLHSQTKQ